jgi:hypothetical protein
VADYSALDRLLHRLALGNRVVPEMLHDLERSRFLGSSPPARDGRHVYVTGLARAGSTILMREIHATGAFGSLTYADMPFVLAPNLWAGLARRRPAGKRAERAHGDGIEVDTHSPEALEEVYWRLFCGTDYLTATGLAPHDPSDEAVDGYVDLIRLVLRHTGKDRYLAKNNNTILRLVPLAQALPHALFLVPIREPLQHAQSLLNQHLRFRGADPFTVQYMTWLGHHEFGATQRPFLMGPAPASDPGSLDYWLEQWITVYSALDAGATTLGNVRVVPHEDLLDDPAIWPALCRMLGVAVSPLNEVRPTGPREVAAHDPAIAGRARAIYDDMRAAALSWLTGARAGTGTLPA